MSDKKLTTEQVVRALNRLASGWPDDLTLFSAAGSLVLLHGEYRSTLSDSFLESAVVESWGSQIRNDGGDPHWINAGYAALEADDG